MTILPYLNSKYCNWRSGGLHNGKLTQKTSEWAYKQFIIQIQALGLHFLHDYEWRLTVDPHTSKPFLIRPVCVLMMTSQPVSQWGSAIVMRVRAGWCLNCSISILFTVIFMTSSLKTTLYFTWQKKCISLSGRHWIIFGMSHRYKHQLNIITIDHLNISSSIELITTMTSAIMWTNAGILLIGPLGANISEILITIYTFSFKKIHLKILSGVGGHLVSASRLLT